MNNNCIILSLGYHYGSPRDWNRGRFSLRNLEVVGNRGAGDPFEGEGVLDRFCSLNVSTGLSSSSASSLLSSSSSSSSAAPDNAHIRKRSHCNVKISQSGTLSASSVLIVMRFPSIIGRKFINWGMLGLTEFSSNVLGSLDSW